MNKIAVIGGGASGIMAALTAKKLGAEVVLAEKNARIGKKILMTGNGRCNFTNVNASPDNYNSDFVSEALNAFSPQNAIDFFEKAGLIASKEAEGRVYPMCGQASALLDILLMELERNNIEILTDFDVKKIRKEKDNFCVLSRDGRKLFADKIIISTGGKAAPKTGSDGSGYELLKELGHSLNKPEPALVQLKTDKKTAGIRAMANISVNGKSEFGELQFTAYGLSGIPILNLSRCVKEGDLITVDLMPQYDLQGLFTYLKNRPKQKLETFLIGILNKPLGQMILKDLNIGKLSRNSATLSDAEFMLIAKAIKNQKFIVTGKMPWDNAQVTLGGIKTEEINPHTMESKKISGIYVTGELLDVDAMCGGYNLQWAWSSGYVAGKSAAGC